jgi:ubiquinone/menaquinone biosynthesis C-methylase UbiE
MNARDQRQDASLGAGSLSFDRVASQYDDTRGYPKFASDAIAEGMMRLGPLARGAMALEIGAGTGRIALPLLERGVNITGSDISERMTERLRAKYLAGRSTLRQSPWGTLAVVMADNVNLPFSDDSFDAVIAVHVLHLMTEWRRALDEALRVLKPGAPLLLGQDMATGSPISHPLQDEWTHICAGLGYIPKRLGAPAFRDVLAEVRARGLRVEEWTVAEWIVSHTVAQGFADIAERTWSLTWQVPDDIFIESVRRLESWARERYSDRWNDPVQVSFSFRLARVTQPRTFKR